MPFCVMVRTISTDLSITLARLRDIGWKEWDPIGLLTVGEALDQKPFVDEYDEYLLKVATDLRDDGPLAQAIEYLLLIEREHMGLGIRVGQEDRAEATARAIQRFVTFSV